MKRDKTKIISGKDLGQLALKDFCPRCFWIERKLGKAPGIFPGIFSSIDSLTKKSVKRSYLERDCLPGWLPIEGAVRPIEFPRISVPMLEYGNWILTGDPDEVFEMDDGSYHIVDYKTAKFTNKQDELLPMYQVQLNAYALALPVYNIKPISKLSLLYCEPKEELDSDEDFCLGFTIQSLEIDLQPKINCKGICSWLEMTGKELYR